MSTRFNQCLLKETNKRTPCTFAEQGAFFDLFFTMKGNNVENCYFFFLLLFLGSVSSESS